MFKKTVRTPFVLALACASGLALAQARGVLPVPGFGDALAGLSDADAAAFAAGLEEFSKVETPETGLGPIFNGNSCAACHFAPAVGGASPVFVTRFGRLVDGRFDPLEEKGGSLLQQHAIDPAVREVIPPEANVVARRMTTPLFGAGLVEAIPDEAIRRGAERPKRDGVAGRVHLVADPASGETRVGRFGWKAQHATLLSFAGDAYTNEMGITNRLFPVENAPNGNRALLAIHDRLEDPEDLVDPVTKRSDIDAAADFMRLLAPPRALAATASSRGGEAIFAQAGCAECHTPAMQTGPSATPALDRKPVALYSDLLLHDMGPLGDGIGQGLAQPREMRTAPLWGLRARRLYLHDGRAGTVEAAILAHAGEASVARDRYARLAPALRRQLLDFLGTI